MFNSKISGIGHFVPSEIMTNNDFLKLGVETSDEWIRERTGIEQRRISNPDLNEFPSDMGFYASKMAIENAGIDKNDIDLILNSCTFPDYLFPNTASLIQQKLELTSMTAALDVNAACSGWLYAMIMANALIQSGSYKNILVLGNEMTSSTNGFKDRSTAILFGDGCGAVLLSRSQKNESSVILDSIMANDPTKTMALYAPFGGAQAPVKRGDYRDTFDPVRMDGQVIFKAAVKTMTHQCQTLLQRQGLTKTDIDWYIPHQANLRIIEAIARRFEFPREKVLCNVQKYANTSSASIPLALSEAFIEGKIKRGQTILMSAFGAGVSSAAMILRY